ncbi:MAG TPA: DUF2330 domain-containing protein, partial [Abditibacteriaceae bacterium]
LFHDGENAHLVIKTSLESTPKSGKGVASLPPFMAWVIPLPSLPSKYEEADPQLFEQLLEATKQGSQRRFGCSGMEEEETAAASNSASIEVHPTEFVGDYEITLVEMLTHDAGDALNEWLAKNGFGKVPKENQAFYVSKGVVFLALKINNLSGSFADLKPLHIVYKSDRATLPLKFSTHSGIFDVILYTFTNSPVPSEEFGDYRFVKARPSVSIGRGQVPALDKISNGGVGYLTLFTAQQFNTPERPVKNLIADPSISADLAVRRAGLLDYATYLLPLFAAAPFFLMWRRFRKSKSALPAR